MHIHNFSREFNEIVIDRSTVEASILISAEATTTVLARSDVDRR